MSKCDENWEKLAIFNFKGLVKLFFSDSLQRNIVLKDLHRWKRDFDFTEHLVYRTPLGDCFCPCWRILGKIERKWNIQKQPSIGILRKRCSESIRQISGRTSKPKCDFNKVARQLYWNHTLVWVFSCKLLHIFRTRFSKNTSEGLLLTLGPQTATWGRSVL